MVDLDLEAGLRKTEIELEALAAKLSSEASPPGPWDSEQAKDLAGMVVGVVGEGLRALIFRERPEKPIQAIPRPRSRFFSRSPAAVVPPPLQAATTAPAPAVAPIESSRPDASPSEPASRARAEEVPTLGLPGLSFVGHLDEAHQERLDIDRTEPISRPALRGPLIGGTIIPSEK